MSDEHLSGLADAVDRQVDRDVTRLGLTGAAQTEVVVVDTTDATSGLQVRVHGRLCRWPDRLGTAPQHGSGDDSPAEVTAAAVAVVCRVLQHRPSVLLGPRQLAAVRSAVALGDGDDDGGHGTGGGEPTLDDTRLEQVVRGVLDVGVSVGDTSTLQDVLADAVEHDDRPEVVVERLIDQLRPPVLQVRMTTATLRRLSHGVDVRSDAVVRMRKDLFDQSGTELPDVELVADDDLPAEHLAVRLNALVTPAIAVGDDDDLLGHAAACLGSALQARWHWFMSTSSVRRQLAALELTFPTLVGAVERRLPVEWLTALLRCMLREHVSVRNVRAVLDDLVDLDWDAESGDVVRLTPGRLREPEGRPWAGLPPPEVALPFLRQRSFERRWPTTPWCPVVLDGLPAEAEQAAVRAGSGVGPGHDRDVDRVLAAVPQALTSTPIGSALVTSSVPVRAAVQRCLQPLLPDVRVLASVELPPTVLVRPAEAEAPLPQRTQRAPGAAPSPGSESS